MSHTPGHPTTGSAPALGSAGGERTIGQLVADASRDLSALVRAEIALAKAEISADVKQGALGAGLFAGAALFGLLAVIMLLFAGAWAISLALPYWLSFLIVGVALLLLAALLGLVGYTRIKKVGPPARTVATSKQSLEALKGRR